MILSPAKLLYLTTKRPQGGSAPNLRNEPAVMKSPDISPATADMLFWGGEDKALKTVEVLPYRSFKAMVDQLLNIAVPINLTKDEFLSMPKEQRAQRKRVPYLVPCSFTKTISSFVVVKSALERISLGSSL